LTGKKIRSFFRNRSIIERRKVMARPRKKEYIDIILDEGKDYKELKKGNSVRKRRNGLLFCIRLGSKGETPRMIKLRKKMKRLKSQYKTEKKRMLTGV